MSKFKFSAGLLFVIGILFSSPAILSASPQESGEFDVQKVIHDEFKARIKAASLGNATDDDSIEAEVRESVEDQLEQFVKSVEKSKDEAMIEIARNAVSTTELADSLTTMIVSELNVEPLDEMEAQSIRDALDDLKVRVLWDYSIAIHALPAEQVSVRIRLPKLHACGGCKASLEGKLNELEGFEKAMVDLETMTAQFVAPADNEVETTLAELEKNGVSQLLAWKLVRR